MSQDETPTASPPSARVQRAALEFWSVLARAYTVVAERVGRAVAKHRLTLAEYGALEALRADGPMLLGELQRHLLVSSGGITYVVDRLAKRGLVTRQVHPTDRRARIATLTDDGARLLSRIAPEHDRAVADAVDGLTGREQRDVAVMLRRLGLRGVAGTASAQAAEDAAADLAPAATIASREGTERILVVDDDAPTVGLMQSRLAGEGREILAARTAAEAESILGRHDVALVILGLVLPDADGRLVYASLSRRESTAAIPVIMTATGAGDRVRAECLGLGVAGWLEKPIEPPALLAAVDASLRRAAAPRSAVTDPISGAANRAGFADAYERTVRSHPAGAPASALALIDWDGFAAVNLALGEEAGNLILRRASDTLGRLLRAEDTLARWREDEFAILFPRASPAEAVRVIGALQAALASAPPRTADGAEVPITFSAGIAAVTAVTSLDEAIALADGALGRAKAAGPSQVATADDARGAPVAILVAEADRVTATLVRHRLQRTGFEVVHRDNGVDALGTAESGNFELVVSDVRMPGLDGFEFLERLRSMPRYANTPVLMLVSLGRQEDVRRAFALGANDYMTKPFSPVELLARAQRLLRLRNAGPSRDPMTGSGGPRSRRAEEDDT